MDIAYAKIQKGLQNDLLLVTGPPSVGKRTLVMKALDDGRKFRYAYVNCYTVTTPTKFFAILFQQFTAALNIRRQEQAESRDFPRFFKECLKLCKKRGVQKLFVVLDHVEVFHRTNLMTCFTSLVSISDLNIVLITYESPIDIVQYVNRVSKSAGITVQDRILPVVIPTWSIEQTTNWILTFQPKEGAEYYKKFVHNNVVIAHDKHKNPMGALLACQDMFGEFLKNRDKVSIDKLKSELEKRKLDTDDDKLDEFELTSAQKNAIFMKSFRQTVSQNIEGTPSWTASDDELKLPHNTSVLIIAAYIAAYTKPSDDKKNFVRAQKRIKHREPVVENTSRPFTLERLYHVYRGLARIIQGTDWDSVKFDNGFVLGDVERLENLNILIHQSGWSVHPDAKYRLSQCVKRNYINRLALNIDLKLNRLHGLPQ